MPISLCNDSHTLLCALLQDLVVLECRKEGAPGWEIVLQLLLICAVVLYGARHWRKAQ